MIKFTYILVIFLLLSCKNEQVKERLIQDSITFFEQKKVHFNYLKHFIKSEISKDKNFKTHYFYYTNNVNSSYDKSTNVIEAINHLDNIHYINVNRNTENFVIEFMMNRHIIDNRKFDIVFFHSQDFKINDALQLGNDWYLLIKESVGI